VVALRPHPSQSSDAALAEQRVADYGSPLFLFGKLLNALLLDHVDTDLARMHVLNEMLEDGAAAFGPGFLDRINAQALRGGRHPFRPIRDLVIRPSADLAILAGQILQGMGGEKARSPLIRLAARNLTDGRRTPESDLLSYLLFDGEFLAPLAELGMRDARAREQDLVDFFTD
jgi:NTE family protein